MIHAQQVPRRGRERSERRSRNQPSTPFQFDVAPQRHAPHGPAFHFCVLKYISMTTNKRAILVRLPEALVDRLDAVAYDLHMRSRSDYIRRSLERAVEFSEAHELPLVNDAAIKRALAQ